MVKVVVTTQHGLPVLKSSRRETPFQDVKVHEFEIEVSDADGKALDGLDGELSTD